MNHPRLTVRNVRPVKDGVYQFTLRLYWGDGTVAYDFLKWRLKPDGQLLSPASKVYGKWVEYGKFHKKTEELVVSALERLISDVTTTLSKVEGLDNEARFLVWAGREEHVVDLS